MSLLLVYGAVLVGIAVLSSARKRTVRIDGGRVFVLHGLFAVAEVARSILVGTWFSAALVVFLIAAAVSYRGRDWWLLAGYDPAGLRAMVEEAGRRLRIDCDPRPDGYALASKASVGSITVRELPAGGALVKVASEEEAPKIELLSSLLAKQFEPLVPRVRIRLK